MDYTKITTHELKLTDLEIDVVKAGLSLLANNATAGNLAFPEHKGEANKMLSEIGVAGYSYNQHQ